MSARERFPHPYKECFILLLNRFEISQFTPLQGPASSLALVPFSNRCGTSQSTPLGGPASLLAHHLVSTPLWGSASSLAHHPMSNSSTILQQPEPTASRYWPLWIFLPSRFLKRARERFPHPYKECFVLLPNRCGISYG